MILLLVLESSKLAGGSEIAFNHQFSRVRIHTNSDIKKLLKC